MTIELKGGKCIRCGYIFNGQNIAAFEFHHTNPQEKDFKIGNVGNKSWKSIVHELAKCELLCANCHSIEHSNILNWVVEESQNWTA